MPVNFVKSPSHGVFCCGLKLYPQCKLQLFIILSNGAFLIYRASSRKVGNLPEPCPLALPFKNEFGVIDLYLIQVANAPSRSSFKFQVSRIAITHNIIRALVDSDALMWTSSLPTTLARMRLLAPSARDYSQQR